MARAKSWIGVVLAVVLMGCGAGSPSGGSLSAQDVLAAAAPQPAAPAALPGVDQAKRPFPFTPGADNSANVALDPDGNLILQPSGPPIIHSYIWIANSGEGTVSKIDTATGQEKARYHTGPGNSDPSRTTVSLEGDVVVANRGGASAARINGDTASCPDKNGNGRVETSTGPQDILAWGQDECVVWFTQFAAGSLARAAAFDYHIDQDGNSSYVWIGLYGTQKIVRLDAKTGQILNEISTPGHPAYGFALDGVGNLWVMEHGASSIVKVNTTTLAWTPVASPHKCNYGITVDKLGRVWTSGGSCVAVYDPKTLQWTRIAIGASNRGVAVDDAGSAWVADTSFGAHRIDTASLTVKSDIAISGGSFVGMAVDFNKQIWAVNMGSSTAYRIDPTTLNYEPFKTGSSPYTYSDMTGFQLQNAAPPLGLYHKVFSCGDGANWRLLSWEADTPAKTSVQFRIRVGNTREQLLTREFALAARQPADASPKMLQEFLVQAFPNDVHAAFLEVEVALNAETSAATPVLKEFNVECLPYVP